MVYDPRTRLYHFGLITGEPAYLPALIDDLAVTRSVEWRAAVDRDRLSDRTKNSLGAILSVFKVPGVSEDEILKSVDRSNNRPIALTIEEEATEVDADPFVGIEELAIERVKDRLNALSWGDMQVIVASLLRALGYRTQISPAGPDRGKDISRRKTALALSVRALSLRSSTAKDKWARRKFEVSLAAAMPMTAAYL